MSNMVVVGRFGKVHGIKGFIQVHSFTEPRENIFDYMPWHLTIKKNWCQIKIHDQKIAGEKFLVQIENYISREEVGCLTNMDIAVPRSILPDIDNQFYHHDLIGMSVYNTKHELLGKIVEIFSTGAHDILDVHGDKQYLIPFVNDVYVKSINAQDAEIIVDWDIAETK